MEFHIPPDVKNWNRGGEIPSQLKNCRLTEEEADEQDSFSI